MADKAAAPAVEDITSAAPAPFADPAVVPIETVEPVVERPALDKIKGLKYEGKYDVRIIGDHKWDAANEFTVSTNGMHADEVDALLATDEFVIVPV